MTADVEDDQENIGDWSVGGRIAQIALAIPAVAEGLRTRKESCTMFTC